MAAKDYAKLLPLIMRMLDFGASALGTRYSWGGNSLVRGVDCSGLTTQLLQSIGYMPPRTAAEQGRWADKVASSDARPGDLVFWDKASSRDRVPGADHVGVYLGNGMVLEASSGQGKVVVRKLWGNYRFGRVIGTKPRGNPQNPSKGNSGVTVQQMMGGQAAVQKIMDATQAALAGAGGGQGGSPQDYGADATAWAAQQAPSLPKNATAEEIDAFISANYGADIAAFMKVPELRKLMIDAARDGVVDPNLIATRLKRTKWWTSRSESMRQWDALKLADPKSAQAALAKEQARLKGTLAQTGADLTLSAFAEKSLRMGLTEEQLKFDIGKALRGESGRKGLDQGTTVDVTADSVMSRARNEFYVPLDRQSAESWAIAIFEGTKTEEQLDSYLTTMARGRFGQIASEMEGAALTPGQYLAPIKNTVAEILELNPADVDLMDPQWSEILDHTDPDGKRRPMTLTEAARYARTKEEYRGTAGANSAASDFGELLTRTFGKTG